MIIRKVFTAWRKKYAELSTATQLLINDNGGTLKGISDFTTNITVLNVFVPKLNVRKQCSYPDRMDCWSKNPKYLNNNSMTSLNVGATVILLDGSMLNFVNFSNNCFRIDPTTGKNYCGLVFVDVNGIKNPNTVGKDIFVFKVEEKSSSAFGDRQTCSADGVYCGSYYLIHHE